MNHMRDLSVRVAYGMNYMRDLSLQIAPPMNYMRGLTLNDERDADQADARTFT